MSTENEYMKKKYLPDIGTFDRQGFFAEKLSLPLLQEAYWNGFFPWPEDSLSTTIPFAHPEGRGLIILNEFHIPHTVKRILKNGPFELRIDTAFEDVLKSCAARNDGSDTWITPEIQRAYTTFHEAGWVHSFEAWNRKTGELSGGLYGVSLGRIFAGESMFYRESGASKFALACLGLTLKESGCVLIDTQMVTPVTEQFGAGYYYREDFIAALETLRDIPLTTEQLRSSAQNLKQRGVIC